MEVDRILEDFRHNNGRFARAATQAAIEKREEITAHLLRILEETIEHVHELAADPSYMAHEYALHLLAQFREGEAYPLVARLFSTPGDVLEDLSGDFLTEGLGLVLASVANGDPSLIQRLVENREALVWARVGALRAIPAMVGAGELSRERALAYLQELLRGKLEREPFEEVVDLWDALISFAIDLHPEEIYDDIKAAFDADLVNPRFVALEDVDRRLMRGKEENLRTLPTKHPLITDAIEEMQWWACFKYDYEERVARERKRWSRDLPDPSRSRVKSHREEASSTVEGSASGWLPANLRHDPPVQTIVRTDPKIGRNAPCPCGSGKKYKKCCGAE